MKKTRKRGKKEKLTKKVSVAAKATGAGTGASRDKDGAKREQ